MIRIEHRKEERIVAKKLPHKYHEFTVSLENGSKESVTCIDISANGLSFLSNLPLSDYPPGTQIELYIDGGRQPLHGIIISSETVQQGVRESVRFQHDDQYYDYLTNFNILVSRIIK
jgi:PilZ domain.